MFQTQFPFRSLQSSLKQSFQNSLPVKLLQCSRYQDSDLLRFPDCFDHLEVADGLLALLAQDFSWTVSQNLQSLSLQLLPNCYYIWKSRSRVIVSSD